MRYMVLVHATDDSEAGKLPSTEMLAEMGEYNEELVKAGVMIAGEGLLPSSSGVRLNMSAEGSELVDGPFTESKELIAGFWIWEVKSLDEAKEWLRRVPNPDRGIGTLELRRIASADDFGENLTDELREQEEQLRAQTPANEQYRA
jgi:hypothetical protein